VRRLALQTAVCACSAVILPAAAGFGLFLSARGDAVWRPAVRTSGVEAVASLAPTWAKAVAVLSATSRNQRPGSAAALVRRGNRFLAVRGRHPLLSLRPQPGRIVVARLPHGVALCLREPGHPIPPLRFACFAGVVPARGLWTPGVGPTLRAAERRSAEGLDSTDNGPLPRWDLETGSPLPASLRSRLALATVNPPPMPPWWFGGLLFGLAAPLALRYGGRRAARRGLLPRMALALAPLAVLDVALRATLGGHPGWERALWPGGVEVFVGHPFLHQTGLFGDEGWQLGMMGAVATALFVAAGRGLGSRTLVVGGLLVALGTGTNVGEVALHGVATDYIGVVTAGRGLYQYNLGDAYEELGTAMLLIGGARILLARLAGLTADPKPAIEPQR
jgi:hypothetical protein